MTFTDRLAARTPCRDSLGNLSCQREGGHSGPHRNKLTVWATRIPRWLERAQERGGLPALDLTGKVSL